MVDEGAANTFARLASELHDQESFEETLELVVESSPALVGSDSASVLLFRRGRLSEPGPGTDVQAEKADGLQLDYVEGPAWLATSESRTVLCRDLLEDREWPRWSADVAGLGMRSALSVRLFTSQVTMGAITFYSARPRTFDQSSLAIAEVVGRHASIALATARHQENLIQAIDGRKLVGQAQGILMERFDLDDRRAFDVLRRYSQAKNVKLIEVARLLVDTRRLPDT